MTNKNLKMHVRLCIYVFIYMRKVELTSIKSPKRSVREK